MLSTAALIGFGALPVFAQSGFPSSFNASVSGIAIGQEAGAAQAIIEGLFPDDIGLKEAKLVQAGTPRRSGDLLKESTVLHPVTQEKFTIGLRGSAVHEITDRSFRTRFAHYADAASILISSPIDGQKVEAIHRRIAYEKPLDVDAVLAKIVETYGEPHAQWARQPIYLWGFKDGKPMQGKSGNVFMRSINDCSNPGLSPRFSQVEEGSLAVLPAQMLRRHFEGLPNSSDKDPARLEVCEAAVRIELHLDAGGLVHMISFQIIDKLAMRDNQEAFLAAIANAQAATAEVPSGKTDVDDF